MCHNTSFIIVNIYKIYLFFLINKYKNMNNLNPLYENFSSLTVRSIKYGIRNGTKKRKKLEKYINQKFSDYKKNKNICDLDDEDK